MQGIKVDIFSHVSRHKASLFLVKGQNKLMLLYLYDVILHVDKYTYSSLPLLE